MQPFMKTPAAISNNADAANVSRTMEGFLARVFGNAPRHITTIVAHNMILVRVCHSFPEAEARMLSNRLYDSLLRQYYDCLFSVSESMLKSELANVLCCGIQQIHHVLNPIAQELDIIIYLDFSSADKSQTQRSNTQ
jgi:hypothetical protein